MMDDFRMSELRRMREKATIAGKMFERLLTKKKPTEPDIKAADCAVTKDDWLIYGKMCEERGKIIAVNRVIRLFSDEEKPLE